MPKRRVLLPVAAMIAAAVAAAPASAAFPGRNGAIVYTQYRAVPFPGGGDDVTLRGDIHSISPDGTGDRPILATKDDESFPAPSPDGRRLAFIRSNRLWTSDIDGTGASAVSKAQADYPAWSADGRRLFVGADLAGIRAIDLSATYLPQSPARTVLAASGIRRKLREFFVPVAAAAASDGRTLYYVRVKFSVVEGQHTTDQIWASNPDGTQRHPIFHGTGDARVISAFDVSPDGRRFAFLSASNASKDPRRVYVVGVDGSGLRLVTTAYESHTSFGSVGWSPDGTMLVVSHNADDHKRGGNLELVDPATGRSTIVRHIPTGLVDEPQWQALPAS